MFHFKARNLTREGTKDVCNMSKKDERKWEEIKSDPIRNFSCKLDSRKCEVPGCTRRTRKALPYCFWHQRSLLHVIIKKSKIPGAGLGLFACDPKRDVVFKKDDPIAIYARREQGSATIGEFMSEKELLDRYGECLTAPYGVDTMKKKQVVDTACQRSIASYANGAESQAKANAEVRWVKNKRGNELMLYAKKNIHDGDEITWYYGNSYEFDYPPIFEQRIWHTGRPNTNPKCGRKKRVTENSRRRGSRRRSSEKKK